MPFPSSTVKDVVTSAHSPDEFFSQGVSASISNYTCMLVAGSQTSKPYNTLLLSFLMFLFVHISIVLTHNRILKEYVLRSVFFLRIRSVTTDTPGNLHNLILSRGWRHLVIRVPISINSHWIRLAAILIGTNAVGISPSLSSIVTNDR